MTATTATSATKKTMKRVTGLPSSPDLREGITSSSIKLDRSVAALPTLSAVDIRRATPAPLCA